MAMLGGGGGIAAAGSLTQQVVKPQGMIGGAIGSRAASMLNQSQWGRNINFRLNDPSTGAMRGTRPTNTPSESGNDGVMRSTATRSGNAGLSLIRGTWDTIRGLNRLPTMRGNQNRGGGNQNQGGGNP
jgi:hypothetical protein